MQALGLAFAVVALLGADGFGFASAFASSAGGLEAFLGSVSTQEQSFGLLLVIALGKAGFEFASARASSGGELEVFCGRVSTGVHGLGFAVAFAALLDAAGSGFAGAVASPGGRLEDSLGSVSTELQAFGLAMVMHLGAAGFEFTSTFASFAGLEAFWVRISAGVHAFGLAFAIVVFLRVAGFGFDGACTSAGAGVEASLEMLPTEVAGFVSAGAFAFFSSTTGNAFSTTGSGVGGAASTDSAAGRA